MMMKWNKLQEVYDKARLAGVSFSVRYAESDNSWSFVISSPAPAENFVSKSRPFETAIEAALGWLNGLLE